MVSGGSDQVELVFAVGVVCVRVSSHTVAYLLSQGTALEKRGHEISARCRADIRNPTIVSERRARARTLAEGAPSAVYDGAITSTSDIVFGTAREGVAIVTLELHNSMCPRRTR